MAEGQSMTTVADVVAQVRDGRLVTPMSSMKGRVMSSGRSMSLTFGVG